MPNLRNHIFQKAKPQAAPFEAVPLSHRFALLMAGRRTCPAAAKRWSGNPGGLREAVLESRAPQGVRGNFLVMQSLPVTLQAMDVQEVDATSTTIATRWAQGEDALQQLLEPPGAVKARLRTLPDTRGKTDAAAGYKRCFKWNMGKGLVRRIGDVPPAMKREILTVFPSANIDKLLIVPTCQHATVDLVKTGENVENEKDRLLERFMAWAKMVCDQLTTAGHWADYIDPCSGLPMIHTELNTVYPEVPALSILMGYQTANAGCCKVLLHPIWGSAVYPASLFTEAPQGALLAAIEASNAAQVK
ncbi:hypothetical protein VOLCADRAFT_90862 [Volvox carteri f. nagariensis]|uniref:Uncharacterized protein n=1 Tax=Volvox carteri f. nagariensis TaxID=3068 RepID=D8TV92_VOLCA|nr:uncharacterized protein VOLCADRAFT_90862 [Volvox carteri f. nagariensis]EFJ48663.1 hypothetical protein VOLCADRAFT_90862 [Volvox carteri f. nagariensis]|eukprot:XP_002950462.1 hypothetical protein VOLCADRAFT_90862 [Volvox carteri f. nagariensis]